MNIREGLRVVFGNDLISRTKAQTDELYSKYTGDPNGPPWELGFRGTAELLKVYTEFWLRVNYRYLGLEPVIKGSQRLRQYFRRISNEHS